MTIYNNPQFDVRIIPSALIVCYKDTATVTVSTTGGTSPYSYSWNTGEMSSTIWAKGDRTYQVYATDRFGCKDDTTIIVGENDSIQVSVTTPPTVCYGYPSQLTAWVNGGSGVFTYSWQRNGIWFGDSIPYAGIYQLIVFDSVGGKGLCTASSQLILVSEFPKLGFDLNVTNPSCNSCCDGKITADVAGGGAGSPFTYQWATDENFTNILSRDTNISGLCKGVYFFRGTDGAGCAVMDTVALDFSGDILDNIYVTGMINTYPNPFDKFIILSFKEGNNSEKIKCKLFNFTGQVINTIQTTHKEKQTNLSIDTGELKPEMYILEVEVGGRKGFYKVVKGG